MISARENNLALCRICHSLTDIPGEKCLVCGGVVHLRDPHSLQKVMAFWVAGVIAFIFGNVFPIMITESLSGSTHSTIIGGVVTLVHHGSYFIALVVFVASIVVPVIKFIVIFFLVVSIKGNWNISNHQRHRVHHAIELIGRWSMIDVFVVAALAALVQLGGIIVIKPGVGISAFALSVALTMISAMHYDSRVIWDAGNDEH